MGTLTDPGWGRDGSVAAMTFYCAGVVARLKPAEGAAATEPRAGFAPRSVEACRVLITLALAYAILSKLV